MGEGTLQFSLRSLFVVVTLCAVACAMLATLGHELVLGSSGFVLACGLVSITVVGSRPLDRVATIAPVATAFLLVPLGYCLLAAGFFLFGEAIDQPHPMYARGNWITRGLASILPVLPFVGAATLTLVALDFAVQPSRPRDAAYYPRAANLRTAFARVDTRLPLLIGVILVAGYYAATVVDVWHNEQLPATVWPPKRVFVTCQLLWGILWVADCLTRPKHGTIVAAVGFLLLTFLFVLPMGFGVLRE